MNIQDLSFVAPGFSVQDLSHRNILTAPLGKVFPVLFEYVNPGEVSELDFSWFCRTFPMLAPLMDTMEITFDGFWVPARVLSHSGGQSIDFDFEEYFNPRNLNSGDQLPNINLMELVKETLNRYGRLHSTLYDYLGYPTFPSWMEKVNNALASLVDSQSNSFTNWIPTMRLSDFQSNYQWSGFSVNGAAVNVNLPLLTATGQDKWLRAGYRPFTLYVFMIAAGLNPDSDSYSNSMFGLMGDLLKPYEDETGVISLERICKVLGTTSEQLYDRWLCSIMSHLFDPVGVDPNQVYHTLFDDQNLNINNQYVSIVPFIVYWKIVFDWYISPLQYDGDFLYKDYINHLLNNDDFNGNNNHDFHILDLIDRLYEFDRYVSATPGGDQPNVMLPASHSVKDIRTANRTQLFLERVMKTGKRYVDQILTTFGVKPSDSRVDRSEVLFRRTQYLDIQSVTQTNQSSLNATLANPLGTQVGQSMTYQQFTGGTFQFDEHGFFVVMASIRPKPTYMQGLDKFLTKLTADKFLIPDFAQIGDDTIAASEIFFDYGNDYGQDPAGIFEPFANQQRYYEYMDHPNQVHGHMLTDLKYYHLARFFSAQPSYNKNFVSVNVQQNDLSRIWAAYDASPFMMFIDFHHKMLRPLPESSTYSL